MPWALLQLYLSAQLNTSDIGLAAFFRENSLQKGHGEADARKKQGAF